MEQKLPPKILKTQFRNMGTPPAAPAAGLSIPVPSGEPVSIVEPAPVDVAAVAPAPLAGVEEPAVVPEVPATVTESPVEPEPVAAQPVDAAAPAKPDPAGAIRDEERVVRSERTEPSERPRMQHPMRAGRMMPSVDSVQPDMPVLAAFQDFLEAERQKMKGRLMTVIVIFALIVLAVGAGSVMLALKFSESSLMTVRDAWQRNLESTQADLAAISGRLASVDEMKAETAKVREELNAKAAVVDALEKRLVGESGDEIKNLKDTLASLQVRNDSMGTELEKLRIAVPEGLESIRKELQRLRDRKPVPAAIPIAVPPAPSTATPPAPATKVTKSLTLSVSPGGSETPVTWKAPIP